MFINSGTHSALRMVASPPAVRWLPCGLGLVLVVLDCIVPGYLRWPCQLSGVERQLLIRMVNDTHQILQDHGIRHYLVQGALLGWLVVCACVCHSFPHDRGSAEQRHDSLGLGCRHM